MGGGGADLPGFQKTRQVSFRVYFPVTSTRTLRKRWLPN